MTYQVLARKWRPQDFSSLIGQDAIVTALGNALREGRVAQAYLFSGIRGVGKTTAARLLAKALNCQEGPTPDPCNECDSCREITGGSDLDVLEVDAATYSKVEQVRELTESLKYGPARDRYKVVILDEIHRLSRQAFDALLKIVEEPPAHLTFIFATTEIEAVPATILSRCQEFQFRRVAADVVTGHLRRLCEAENIEASEPALRLIARAGEGSVRDSVALLDQLATFGSGSIADQEAIRLVGGLDTALFHRLLEAILKGHRQDICQVVAQVDEQGWDPRHVYAQFLTYTRDALHAALGAAVRQIDLPEEEAKVLVATARECGYENLLRLLTHLLSSEEIVRRSEAAGLAAEIAWLRAAELPTLIRVEALLATATEPAVPKNPAGADSQGGGSSLAPRFQGPSTSNSGGSAAAPDMETGSGGASTESRPPAPSTAETQERPEADDAMPLAQNRRPAVSAGPEQEAASNNDPSDLPPAVGSAPLPTNGQPVQTFLQELSRHRQVLAAHLAEAQDLVFRDGELQVVIAQGDRWLTGELRRMENRTVLQDTVTAVWGQGSRWRMVESSQLSPVESSNPEPRSANGAPSVVSADSDPVGGHPVVQTVLDIFGGTIENIRKHPLSQEE